MTQLLETLREEHRDIEILLLVLEQELIIFDRAGQPDYQVIRGVIEYFRDYPDCCHHPKEDAIFIKLKTNDAEAAAMVGDLESEHQKATKRLELMARAVESVLGEWEVLRQAVDDIVRDFIDEERRHIEMEERVFFPAAARALRPEDWAEIDAALRNDPSLDRAREEMFNGLRRRILQWEQESASDDTQLLAVDEIVLPLVTATCRRAKRKTETALWEGAAAMFTVKGHVYQKADSGIRA